MGAMRDDATDASTTSGPSRESMMSDIPDELLHAQSVWRDKQVLDVMSATAGADDMNPN